MIAASVAAPIIGGLVGNIAAQGDRDKQRSAMKAALAELNRLGTPPDLSKEILLQELQRQGVYTPQMEEEIAVAESELAQVKEDPALREAGISALRMMQQRAKTGLSAEDRAALNQVRQEVQRDAEAKRQQILQQMQSRGMAGSGQELAMQLQAAQGTADQAAAGSDQLMAQAQQRALAALGQSSDMAANMRRQDFDVESARARALDERNRFLAENSTSRQTRNVTAMNQAQRANLEEQQRIADYNTQLKNQEKLRQAQAQRDFFQDKLGLARAKSGALSGQADFYGQQAQQTTQQYAGMGSAIGGGITAYGQQQQSNKLLDLLAKK